MDNNQSQQPVGQQNQQVQQQSSSRGLYKAAYILMIITTVLMAIAIIPLAWLIPMTVSSKKCMQEVGTPREASHTGLGVCTLLFANWISGILILIASSGSKN